MKRAIALLLAFIAMLTLCSCAVTADTVPEVVSEESESETVSFANEDDFLSDMAAGIEKRYGDNTDSDTLTGAEKAAYYEKLVGYELERIGKYEDQTFADSTFNELAHLYIEACKMQFLGAQSYRNEDLYNGLWSGAFTVRCAIIVELYERYDLPLSSDAAAAYRTDSSTDVTYSVSSDGEYDFATGLTFYNDNEVTCDTIKITEDSGQILYEDEDITITLKSLENQDGYNYNINMTIENNGSEDKVSCFCGSGYAYIDDYKIDLYCPYGYDWVAPGKRGDTYSYATKSDIEASGLASPKWLTAHLCVITTDGKTGQYIAVVPLEIDFSLFE